MWMTVDATYTDGVAGIAAVVWSRPLSEEGSTPLYVAGERVKAESIMDAEYKALLLAIQLAKSGDLYVQTDSKNIATSIAKLQEVAEWTSAHTINLHCDWAARTNNSIADAFAAIAFRRGKFVAMLKGQP